jgi:hypothetical protein
MIQSSDKGMKKCRECGLHIFGWQPSSDSLEQSNMVANERNLTVVITYQDQ